MLLTLDEFCNRALIFLFAREAFREFVQIKGMELVQTSTTWRRLWNEFRRGARCTLTSN